MCPVLTKLLVGSLVRQVLRQKLVRSLQVARFIAESSHLNQNNGNDL